MNFYLINNTQWPVSEQFVGWLLHGIARELPRDKKAAARFVGVVVASLPQMIDLNGHFRKKKGATDVLSFEGGGGEFQDSGFLGDVVICYEVMAQQAKDHGLDESEEFAYLLLHGILHLLGYEHETNASDAQIMLDIQDKIFEKLMDQDIFKAYRADTTGSRNGKKAQPRDSLQRNEGAARQNGRKGLRPAEVSLTWTASSSNSKNSATNRKTRKSGATPSSSKKSTKRSRPSKKSARSGKA